MEDKRDDTVLWFGDAVKKLDKPGKVGGYLVRFRDGEDVDTYGDYFDKTTNFGTHNTTAVYYQHGYDGKLKKRILDPNGKISIDDIGVWVEAQLQERDEYEKYIMQLVEEGVLGWSSGTAGHLVEVEKKSNGNHITNWPLGLDASLTPTPAEFRNSVIPLKSLQPQAQPQEPEGSVDAVQDEPEADNETIKQTEPIMENLEMSEQVENKEDNAVLEALKAISERLDKIENTPANEVPFVAPKNVQQMKAANVGDPDPVKDFYNYLRGGTPRIKAHWNTKAAMQEGTTTEGGYWVPEDELGRIIQKRNEVSLVGPLGISVFNTNSDKLNVPTEGTAMTAFTLVAEEGAITAAENEPTAGQEAISVYNYKKLIKISDEMLEDENSGTEMFLADAIARSWGITENNIIQVGAGTTAPEGVFVGGTAGLTLDSTSAIGPAELPELMGKLKPWYRNGAKWLMAYETEAYLMGLRSTSDFDLIQQPIIMYGDDKRCFGYPYFATEDTATIAASAKSLLFGNFGFYALVRNRGLKVRRLTELYAGNGQVGILANFRVGGAVLQAEAFQYATHPSA